MDLSLFGPYYELLDEVSAELTFEEGAPLLLKELLDYHEKSYKADNLSCYSSNTNPRIVP